MLRSCVEQEPGGTAADAVIALAGAVRQIQPVLGPGKSHIAQPALLLQLFPGVGPLGGKNPLGKAAEEYCRELQTLGRVHGHEFHSGGLLHGVHIGKQGRMGQITLQRHQLPGPGLVVVDGLLQFRQVVQPVLLAGQPQHGLIAALRQNFRQQIRQIHARIDDPVFLNHPGVLRRPAFPEQLRLQVLHQGLIEAHATQGGIILEISDAGTSHATPRLVDSPQEGHIVP